MKTKDWCQKVGAFKERRTRCADRLLFGPRSFWLPGRLSTWLALACVPLTLLLVRLYPWRPLQDLVPQSTTIWSADGELLRATLASDGQYRLWTPLHEMSPALVSAFKLKEDRWFYWHPGVNPVSLVRAARAVRRLRCNSRASFTT